MSNIEPEKISNLCRDIIKQYIPSAFLPIKIKPESDNIFEERYSLGYDNGNYKTPLYAQSDRGDRLVQIFPLAVSASIKETFWICFSIKFNVIRYGKTKANFTFDGVSICIFKGNIAADENKEMLFRAEWDCKSDKKNKIHPHPHWHIHFTKEKPLQNDDLFEFIKNEDSEINDFSLTESYKEKSIDKFNISKFHFAMGASWLPERSDKLQLDEKSLKGWLNYTLEHIKEQLEYAAS